MDSDIFTAVTGLSDGVLDFLMQQSLYAAAAAAVVWTVLAVVKPRHPLLHLALWWFVLARLVLPADLAASWSLRTSAETLLAKVVWPLGEPHVNVIGGEGSVPVSALARAPTEGTALPVEAVTATATAGDMLPVALFLFWLGGAVAMAILLVRAERSARNTIAMAEAAQDPLLGQLVDAWARRFGISRRVRVLVTEEATAPFTAGVLRPVIVLPRTLLDRLDAVEMSAVIGHEMSHIRSFDVVWRMVERALLVLFFFHPMVWMAVRRIDTAREAACDVSAANSGVVARNSYAKSLLSALKAFRIEPEMAFARTLSIQGGTGDGLKTRLVWLKGETAMSTPAKIVGTVGIVGLGLLVLPMAEARQTEPSIETGTLTSAVTTVPVPPSAPAVKAAAVKAPEAPAAPAAPAAPVAPPAPVVIAGVPDKDFEAKLEQSIDARIEAEEAAREAELEAAEARREAEMEAAEARREARLAAAEAKREAEQAAREARLEGQRAAMEARREALLAASEARREAHQAAAEARREAMISKELGERIRRDVLRATANSLRATAKDMRANPQRFTEGNAVAYITDSSGKAVRVETDMRKAAERLEAEAARLEQQLKDI